MHCLVGLGNPGAEYAATRHNAGWHVLDELAERHGIELSRRRLRSRYGRGRIAGQDCLLVKPQTFMNASGEAVARVLMYYRLPVAGVLVIYDDVNLPLGVLRLRRGGSDGGHKGMRSVIHHLHTRDVARLRMGIGHPPPGAEIMPYVLRPCARHEQEPWRVAVQKAADAVTTLVTDGLEAAMNAYNS